jgi:hypothetical protein
VEKELFGYKSTISLYTDLSLGQGNIEKFPILIDLKEYVNRKDTEESFLDFWYRNHGAFWKGNKDKFESRLNKGALRLSPNTPYGLGSI